MSVLVSRLIESIAAEIGIGKIRSPADGRQTPLYTDHNISQFPVQKIPAVIFPESMDDVKAVVRLFNQARGAAKLQPISTGMNWGLGSSTPVEDGTVLLDLGRMRKIRATDTRAGWSVIEPGVTQASMGEALKGTERMLNVTASSGHTSILGNMLDRGVGLQRQRTSDILGLEVVLASGEVIYPGWWPTAPKSGAINQLGLGPSLLHLFTQSSFGIVTAAAVGLLPRPEASVVIHTSFADVDVVGAIETLRGLCLDGLVSGVIKIYDRGSGSLYGGLDNERLVLCSVSGSNAKVAAVTELVRAALDCSGIFSAAKVVDASYAQSNLVARIVERLYVGDVSESESVLVAATGQNADKVDESDFGWIFFLPLIPFTGGNVQEAYRLVEMIQSVSKLQVGTTVNVLTPDVIDFVVSFRFRKSDSDIASARSALDLAYERFSEHNYIPYRLDIEHGDVASEWMRGRNTDNYVRKIKRTFDPWSIISSGRYTPL